MISTRKTIISVALVGLGVLFACSSGSSTTSKSGSAFKTCPTSSQSSCSQADLDTYDNCQQQACDANYQECFGAGYATGSFGGACGNYISCMAACSCNDSACALNCTSKADATCQSCTQKLDTCTQSAHCTKPACMSGSASSSSSSSTGGTSATCADLQACCNKITDAQNKSACQSAHDQANGSDSTCSQFYSGFKSLCP